MIKPHSRFKITRISIIQDLRFGNTQSKRRNKTIDTITAAAGPNTFAIAAISILPVSTPMFAISHEKIPENRMITMAVIFF